MSRGKLYLLVEESAREMASRLLIAIHAARLGFEVVIGPQWLLPGQASRLPKGVVLFKGNNRIQADNMRLMRASGHAIASIEEEVLGLISEARIVEQYDRRINELCDLLLCQGEFQKNALAGAFPRFPGHMEATGNPRLDFLRAPLNARILKAAAAIRAARGPFILINSNYSSINPRHGDTLTNFGGWVQAGFVNPDSPGEVADYMEFCGWERQNLHALLSFIRGAAGIGLAGRMVLRPHPAEATWRWRRGLGAAAGTDIEIVEDGDHLAWISASELLVHTSCTTGLEAAILGARAINLDAADGPRSSEFGCFVANPRTSNPLEAVELARSCLESPAADGAAFAPPASVGGHWRIDEISAAEKIALSLADLHTSRGLDGGDGGGGGDLKLDDAGLTDWQTRKFTVDVPTVRAYLADFRGMLGFSETFVVEELSGSSMLIKSTR